MLGLSVGLAACGVPGPPVPPTVKVPAVPKELTASQVGERVVLRWTPPRLNTDGTGIEGWPRLEVHRAFLSDPAQPEERFAEQARIAYTIPEQVVDTFLHDGVMVFPDVVGATVLKQEAGRMAVYGVKAVNAKGQDAGFSNLAEVRLYPVPTPITRIGARVRADAIELRWTPPLRTTSGTPVEAIAGYEIYRSDSGEEGSFILHGTAAVARYEDTQFDFGQRYFYHVRTLGQFGADTVESENSALVEVLARDVFPPPVPANLIAVAGPARVELTWDASPTADLAGYFLYRSRQLGAGYERLTARSLRAQSFSDTQLEPGVAHYYVVTAVDREGNESGYSEEAAATPFPPE